MATMQLEAKKAHIIREEYKKNTSSRHCEGLAEAIQSHRAYNLDCFTTFAMTTPPCQLSIEELKDGLIEFYNASDNGELVSHEEVKRMFS